MGSCLTTLKGKWHARKFLYGSFLAKQESDSEAEDCWKCILRDESEEMLSVPAKQANAKPNPLNPFKYYVSDGETEEDVSSCELVSESSRTLEVPQTPSVVFKGTNSKNPFKTDCCCDCRCSSKANLFPMPESNTDLHKNVDAIDRSALDAIKTMGSLIKCPDPSMSISGSGDYQQEGTLISLD